MSDPFGDVLAFHRKFGCHVGTIPALPPSDVAVLRGRLIREEFEELMQAIAFGDLPGIADGAADLVYVVLGTLASYGISFPEVWEAVHRANMSKEGGGTRHDGKVQKPDGWLAPDIAGILARQRPLTIDGGEAR